MNKAIRNYSILSGLLVSILFLGPFLFSDWSEWDCSSMKSSEVIGYTTMVLSLIPIFFGTRAYRNQLEEQSFSFLRGLRTSVIITLIASVIFYFFNVLLYEVIEPNFLSDFAVYYEGCLMENATSEAERELKMAELKEYGPMMSNSYLYAFVMASSVFFIGLIISLISSLILQRKAG